MELREIGSEYWTFDDFNDNNSLKYLNIGKDFKLFMSGRTSIDFVLNDIEDNKKIVYMPNYCCESMIQPFIDNNYEIKFYSIDVINNKYEIDINYNCSIFFAMSYFGYSKSNMDDYIEKFTNRNIIVIEDITHRLLSDKNHCQKSTYLIASLRKWFPLISGGISINMKDKFKNNLSNYIVDEHFVEIKEKAMNLKKEYIKENTNNKEDFLELFHKANNLIEEYKNKKIDNKSLDLLKKLNIKKIKEIRINNTKIIEEKLKNKKNIKLLYKYQNGDCPLFVPIVIENRDNIRNQLMKNNIYLPVHWPNNRKIKNNIYDLELSLINDQRYCKKDIEEYIEKLIEIVGE